MCSLVLPAASSTAFLTLSVIPMGFVPSVVISRERGRP
jgi:hypothetical protein